MSLTCLYITRLAPSMVSDTAIVMIIATVIVTLRHSPTITSDRMYFARIGVWILSAGTAQGDTESDGSAVHTAGLVPNDLAALDLDDAATHLVHDVGVVRDHHDGGAGVVDPGEQPNDLDGCVRVQVSGRLIGQQDQWTVHERAGDRHALLLAAGQLVGVAVLLAAEADQLEHLGHDPAGHRPGLAEDLQRERHVLIRRARRQQPEILEDAADLAAEVGDAPGAHRGHVP